jgi:hypothetical protein
MPNQRVDVTVHIDEELDSNRTNEVCELLRHRDGVFNVHCAEHKKHLLVVEYDPESITSGDILQQITGQGLHGELVGL